MKRLIFSLEKEPRRKVAKVAAVAWKREFVVRLTSGPTRSIERCDLNGIVALRNLKYNNNNTRLFAKLNVNPVFRLFCHEIFFYFRSDDSENVRTRTKSRISHPDGTSRTTGTSSRRSIAERNVREYPGENPISPTTRAIAKATWAENAYLEVI